jgi:outer membrane protein
VNTQQALASGLPEFESGGGIVSIGFGASGIVPLTKRISLIALAGFDHLTGDVAASPLVEERGTKNNGSVGLFLSYDLGL